MVNPKRKIVARRSVRGDDGTAFFPDPASGPALAPDAFAEELAEEFLASALSGQEQTPDFYDRIVEEEEGGPFIPSSERRELSRPGDASTDVSNDDYEQEAFPTLGAGLAVDPFGTEEEEEEE